MFKEIFEAPEFNVTAGCFTDEKPLKKSTEITVFIDGVPRGTYSIPGLFPKMFEFARVQNMIDKERRSEKKPSRRTETSPAEICPPSPAVLQASDE